MDKIECRRGDDRRRMEDEEKMVSLRIGVRLRLGD
jgi:hypothetical protein